MARNYLWAAAAVFAVLVIAALALYRSPFTTSPNAGDSVTVQTKNGQAYLADSNGMALYYFAMDQPGNANLTQPPIVACVSSCLRAWHVFYTNNVLVHQLNATDFTIFTRSDGLPQVAYKGRPLYHYSLDKNPGDTNGNGVNNLWSLAAP